MTSPAVVAGSRGLSVAIERSGVLLLRQLAFQIVQGERVAVLGESGSGKTLFGRSLAGVLPHGLIANRDADRVADADPDPEPRSVTMIPQGPASALPPLLRVVGLVSRVLTWKLPGSTAPEIRERALTLLQQAGYPTDAQSLQKRPFQLSGGLAQRIAIAAALATAPELLVLDEPTVGLDPLLRAAIRQLLLQINTELGVTLVITTHDIPAAEAICQRAIVLRAGEIYYDGSLSSLALTKDAYLRRLLNPVGVPAKPKVQHGPTTPTRGGLDQTAEVPSPPPVVDLQSVSVSFPLDSAPGRRIQVLHDASVTVWRRESVALIGTSGAGKSTLGLVAAGVLRPTVGRVLHSGSDVRCAQAGRPSPVQMVFQNPFQALNPKRTLRSWLTQVLAHRRGASALSLHDYLDLAHFPSSRLDRLPGQLSGGECQRACIASALAAGARAIILDEPVTMLDSIARQVVRDSLLDLLKSTDLALMLITHDVTLAEELCSRVLVMHDGRIIEAGAAEQVFSHPRHPLTEQLLQCWSLKASPPSPAPLAQ